MDNYDVGIVLTTQPGQTWEKLVPKTLIYDNPDGFESAIRKIINRQLAIQGLQLMQTSKKQLPNPVVIILDDVALENLNARKIGVPDLHELLVLFTTLNIIIEYGSPMKYSGKLFMSMWNWLDTSITRKSLLPHVHVPKAAAPRASKTAPF